MPVFNNMLAGASGGAGGAGYEIERSLRFNSGDSSYLSRQPSAAGNRKTWTWSAWVKRSGIGANDNLFKVAGSASRDTQFTIMIHNGNYVSIDYGGAFYLRSTRLLRDPSAWQHWVVSVDTTNSTANNRIRLYINGVEETDFVTRNNPNQNEDLGVNRASEHTISTNDSSGLDGYLADVHFIDGQALAATDFGAPDDNGVWQPKKYAGQYNYPQSGGSSSAPTSTTDVAPSGSYGNGIASAALLFGSSELTNGQNHIRQDNGGIEWSPAIALTGSDVAGAKCLYFNSAATSYDIEFKINGSWVTAQSNARSVIGTNQGQGALITLATTGNWTGVRVTGGGNIHVTTVAGIFVNGTRLQAAYSFPAVNGFHLDFADNSSNAALGTDTSGNSNTWTVNNLVATAGLETANQGFDVVTYTGNGGTQSISSLAFQPDFVWIKSRDYSQWHKLFDSVRGATKGLSSNSTGAETTEANELTAFLGNGFTVGSGAAVNEPADYVAWCWKAGGAAVSNTDGSVTSQVSANTTYGFSVVTYTGSNSLSTVGHGLGNTPGMYIVKRRTDAGYGWIVYHSAMGASNMMALQNGSGAALDFDPWNQTAPTSSVFTVNTTGSGTVNAASKDYVAYVWSEVAGFSKFGSYTGNGSSTGPVVTTGFKPRWLMVKGSSHASNWNIVDTARSPSNPQSNILRANSSAAEFSTPTGQFGLAFDALDDGFQLKSGSSTNDVNQTGETYIYAAFAAKPDGSVIDSLVDSPSQIATPTDTGAGGEVVGNYATMNPLDNSNGLSLSNGNLEAENTGASNKGSRLNFKFPSSGKWYIEATGLTIGGNVCLGISPGNQSATVGSGGTGYILINSSGEFQRYDNVGNAISYSGFNNYTTGAILQIAFDADNDRLWFGLNNQWMDSGSTATGNPSNGSNPTLTSITNVFPSVSLYTSKVAINAGQRDFAYTAPSGYKALCTANLPEPTIADGSQYFDTKLYTGNDGTQTISGFNFAPSWVWIKSRSSASSHCSADIVVGANKHLLPNETLAEATGLVPAFTSDGFTVNNLRNGADNGTTNDNNLSYVSWVWDGGTSTVTNNDGSITSSVRANPTAGFSIVKYNISNAGSTISTFGTGLNAAPAVVFLKPIDDAQGWTVYHKDIPDPTENYLFLQSTAAYTNSNVATFTSSSSTFGCRETRLIAGGDSANIIAYCFSSVAGYSAIGSYTGNGGSQFVYLGFRPKWILFKNVTQANSWFIMDAARNPFNVADKLIHADASTAETTYGWIDLVSNGFQILNTATGLNNSGIQNLYIAFAEHPFKTARAR